MLTLHLGVVEQPYGHAGAKSTYDVAQILQAKYGLFSVFAEMESQNITAQVENSLQGALETMFGRRGSNVQPDAFNSATSAIEELFRDAIDQQRYNGVIPGVPTQAALDGVRHSWSRPYKRTGTRRGKVQPGSPRASFFATGLLSSSFRAWVD